MDGVRPSRMIPGVCVLIQRKQWVVAGLPTTDTPAKHSNLCGAAMSSPILVPLTQPETWLAAGIHYPKTTDQARWLYRHRDFNGLAEAFCNINGRICLNLPRYLELTATSRSRVG